MSKVSEENRVLNSRWIEHIRACIVCRRSITEADEDGEPTLRFRVPEMCVDGASVFRKIFPPQAVQQ